MTRRPIKTPRIADAGKRISDRGNRPRRKIEIDPAPAYSIFYGDVSPPDKSAVKAKHKKFRDHAGHKPGDLNGREKKNEQNRKIRLLDDACKL